MALVRWGLIPSWVKDPRAFKMLINARAETAAEKPSFRGAMRHRRCLVPIDGFYEWSGAPGAKQPHLVRPRGGGPMALAGHLRELARCRRQRDRDDGDPHGRGQCRPCRRCTTACRRSSRRSISTPGSIAARARQRISSELLAPAPEDFLDIIEVSRALNNPRNEGPEVQEPVGTLTLL